MAAEQYKVVYTRLRTINHESRPLTLLYSPSLPHKGGIRMFEVCRNSSLVQSLISNIRSHNFLGTSVYFLVSLSSLRSVLVLFHGEKEQQDTIQLYYPSLTHICGIRMFEVCRDSSLVLFLISNIRSHDFFCFFFEEKKK